MGWGGKPQKHIDSLEHGGYLYINPSSGEWGIIEETTRKKDGLKMSPPWFVQGGMVLHGTVHTHPYSPSEGSLDGISFSDTDIIMLRDGGLGDVMYVKAGTCIFALHRTTKDKPSWYSEEDLKDRYAKAYAAASGTKQEKIEAAVKAAAKYAGLTYYKDCSNADGKADSTCLPVK